MDVKKPTRPTNQYVAQKSAITRQESNVSLDNTGALKRKWPVALTFAILFGWMGLDRFYLGRTGVGLLKLCTFGLFGILWIIDIIMISTKSIRGVVWEKRNLNKSLLSQYTAIPIAVVIFFFLLLIGFTNSTLDNHKYEDKGSSATQASKGYRFTEREDKQKTDVEILTNEAATLNGVKMTMTNVEYKQSLSQYDQASTGQVYILASIKLENISDKTQPYNGSDFRIQTASGQVLDTTFATLEKPLSYGDLVHGGRVDGQIIFEAPVEEGHQYLIWKPGFAPDRAIVQIR